MTSKSKEQLSERRQRLRRLGYSTVFIREKPASSEFDVAKLIKRNSGESAYKIALKYRSKEYGDVANKRSRALSTTVIRRRKNTESAMTSDCDGRSSVMSNVTEQLDLESYFKENYDFDGEEPVEPPLYPHLVHIPGTYSQELYLRVCQQLGITHSSTFYKQLTKDSIDIRGQHIGPRGMKACAAALMENLVHTLDLSENNLDDKAALYIAELLFENNIIRNLILSDNSLGYEGISQLADVIQKTDVLTSLHLSGNSLDDHQIEAVRPIIEETTNLQTLNLSHNDIGVKGGKILADALTRTDTLQNLDLSWNQLRCNGVVKLAAALSTNSSLVYLNLSWTGLHTNGCKGLARALEKNISLKELDISNNRINTECLRKLFPGLKKNTTLNTLHISHNPLNEDDALAMLTFINDTPSSGLTMVDMKDTMVDDAFLKLLEVVQASRKVTFINGNTLGSNLSVHDYDEGALLEFNSDAVLRQLGNILGIDIYNIISGMCKERGANLSPAQMVEALRLLQNPLSTKCTEILVKRLPRDNVGNVDIRHLDSDLALQHNKSPLHRHGSTKPSPHDPSDDDTHNEAAEDDITDDQRIKKLIFRVLTRKLASSRRYRLEMETMGQDGEQHLKELILEHLDNKVYDKVDNKVNNKA